MTQLHDTTPLSRPRTELDILEQQLAGIAQFNRAWNARWVAGHAGLSRTREQRMDLARQEEVRQRQHDALVARLHAQLEADVRPLLGTWPRRLVLAHRSPWFVDKVAAAVEAHGLEVAARLDNGADAVGAIVAEQPDLALVEDTLAMVQGDQVVREVRQFCPDTVIVAQVPYADRVDALVDAGADEVFTRCVPPADVAARLLEMLGVQRA